MTANQGGREWNERKKSNLYALVLSVFGKLFFRRFSDEYGK
jgi:hypothetical protein